MKNIVLIALAAFFLSSCGATMVGSGNIISERRNINNFTGIVVSSSIDVTVTQAANFDVEVTTDDNLMKYVKTELSDGVLKIFIDGINNFSAKSIKVNVSLPLVKRLKATSSASIEASRTLTSDETITIEASSSASIKADVNAPQVNADGSSSADIELSGLTKEANAEASSSATVQMQNLKAENANAEANSSGTIKLFTSVKLHATASSSGTIRYAGGAKLLEISKSSSGDVLPM
jgi:hypothetical protein